MADIFISYAREDRETAKTLAQVLAVQGWSVWWDRHIPGGRRFHDVIQRELTAARCVIALWSTAALGSPWVREEAQDGLDRNILLPARIETVQLPIGFRTVQTADLSDWNGNPAHPGFTQLVEDIRAVLGEALPQTPVSESKTKPHRPAEAEARQAAEEQQREIQRQREQDQDKAEAARVPTTARKNDAHGRQRLKLMTAVGLVVLGFAGVLTWQQWPTQERSGPAETAHKDQEKEVPSKDEVPDWVPVYPFAEQENIFLRRGAGSLSFETGNSEQHVSGAYAAKLKAIGWKVETGYNGGYWAAGTSPDQQRSVAAIARSAGVKTNVAVSFVDSSLVPSEEAFSPEIVPSWVPVYPGKMENLRYKGHSGGFSITTTDSEQQVSGLYAAILRASGYEVATGYDGG